MQPTQRLNEKDTSFDHTLKIINRVALVSCWVAVLLDAIYFMATDNVLKALLYAQYTPIRYFFFDIAPEKEQKRPPSLDRTIPLTIFVRYLSRRFPIPQGSLMADLWGFFLAVGRAMINGYALLLFDTFSFAYSIRNDKHGVPLEQNIVTLHDNQELEAIKNEAEMDDDPEKTAEAKRTYEAWKQTQLTNELDQWDFPIRRYMYAGDDYMSLKEVGAEVLDDKYQLDLKAYKKHERQVKQDKHPQN